MKTIFIGIGAQKCASTWLYQALGSHPAIGTSEVKELDFFTYTYGRGFEWYESFNDGFADRQMVGEVSPSYFHHLEAPRRARDYNPDLKVIALLRDPIERAYSNHLHLIRLGFIKGDDKTFEHGIRNSPMYLHQSRYSVHLSRWLSFFQSKSIHVVLQEDVQADSVGEMKRMFEFLGVDPDAGSLPSKERVNRSVVPKNQKLDKGLKSVGRLARRLGLESAIKKMKSSGAIQRMRSQNEVDLRELVPPPRPETITELKKFFEDDVRYVCQLLGRKSLPWKHFSGTEGSA